MIQGQTGLGGPYGRVVRTTVTAVSEDILIDDVLPDR